MSATVFQDMRGLLGAQDRVDICSHSSAGVGNL